MCDYELTSVSLWKMTTRPPLSPVARRSPVWLNSTVEMTSAGRMEQFSKKPLEQNRGNVAVKMKAGIFLEKRQQTYKIKDTLFSEVIDAASNCLIF